MNDGRVAIVCTTLLSRHTTNSTTSTSREWPTTGLGFKSTAIKLHGFGSQRLRRVFLIAATIMGSFLSSAAFAFAIFELLAFAKPPRQTGRSGFSVAGVAVRFRPRLASFLHYVVLATSISLV